MVKIKEIKTYHNNGKLAIHCFANENMNVVNSYKSYNDNGLLMCNLNFKKDLYHNVSKNSFNNIIHNQIHTFNMGILNGVNIFFK